MRSVQRGTNLVLGLAAVFGLALAGAAPAAAEPEPAEPNAAPEATWKLKDVDQRVCIRPADRGWPNTYVLAPISGTLSEPLTTGVTDMPPGSESHGGKVFPPDPDYDSIPPGFVGVSFGPAPVGDHIAQIWASDGEVTQTVPVLLRYTNETACRWEW